MTGRLFIVEDDWLDRRLGCDRRDARRAWLYALGEGRAHAGPQVVAEVRSISISLNRAELFAFLKAHGVRAVAQRSIAKLRALAREAR